jgi:hypothetical protein
MPTIPLLADPANPNGSHHMGAPGGYEAWHFDASSDDGKLHMVAALHEAWGLDPAYLRKYAWYRRFPTRIVPPNPLDFPAVTFVLCEEGRQTIRFNARTSGGGGGRSAGEVRVSDDGSRVRVGASHAERSPSDQSIHLHLRGTDRLRTIAVNLTFRPVLRAATCREITLRSGPGARGLHRWVIVDPLCEVEGEISIFEPSGGATPRTISFAGSGLHDHRYGTRPRVTTDCFAGRVLLEEGAFAFEQIGRGGDAIIVSATAEGIDVHRGARVEQHREDVRVGMIHLSRPRVLESDRYQTLLAYDARVVGESGVALCRTIRRRRWIAAG